MNTDQLAYEVFVADPGSYFEMIGEPRSEAEHYVFHAVDLKAIERRLDGYFAPKDANRPLHFAEISFYKKENAYANLFAKVFLKLEQEPARDWRAVLFFESETLLPAVELPYENLLVSKRVRRVYL
jgi:predicted transposase YdaD